MVRDGARVGVMDGLDLLDACFARGETEDRPIGPPARFGAPTLRAVAGDPALLAEGHAGAHTGNLIRPDDLNRLERDVLRDSLVIVKRFKEFVSHHFRLTMF